MINLNFDWANLVSSTFWDWRQLLFFAVILVEVYIAYLFYRKRLKAKLIRSNLEKEKKINSIQHCYQEISTPIRPVYQISNHCAYTEKNQETEVEPKKHILFHILFHGVSPLRIFINHIIQRLTTKCKQNPSSSQDSCRNSITCLTAGGSVDRKDSNLSSLRCILGGS